MGLVGTPSAVVACELSTPFDEDFEKKLLIPICPLSRGREPTLLRP